MQLRFAVPSDAGALLRIYDEYINTSITFEYALPGEAEFAARIADISAEYPYLALFDGGVPAAYAYAHRAQARAAYGWNAELSIYIAQAYAGHGLGRLLYEALMELLRRQGSTVDVSSDGVSGYDNASTDLYDLILLDAMLPGMDGFTLLRKLRAGGHAVPVLMLTARSDLSDRVQGLDCGADYYLTKPFEPEELLACVRSLLRRGGGDARTDDAITFGDLRLEPGTFQLSCGERSLRLSRREYDMLELLLRSQGRVVPKEQLLLKVWGYDSDAEDNNVEVYISFLRRKLTHLHSAVTIRTRRMVGYFLEVEA